MNIKLSVCLATYKRPMYLDRALRSIVRQNPPFGYEVIVADDGTPSSDNRIVCSQYPHVQYHLLDAPPGYRNPSTARNVAYKAARGEVVICQSDDVEHQGEAMAALVAALRKGEFVIATVLNKGWNGEATDLPIPVFTSPQVRRPFFFLGALWRTDLYAVGGNDERFVSPAWDDNWFASCLTEGLGLKPRYIEEAVGHHLDHTRPADLSALTKPSEKVHTEISDEARRTGRWATQDAPWGIIPKQMSLFWAGRMSWMRYLTLQSFRLHHPDWKIVLASPEVECGRRSWNTHENDDTGYVGHDYNEEVDALGVTRETWSSPIHSLAPAHACDLFQWGALATSGGFYSDMDVLWLRSLEPLRRQIEATNAAFCLEDGMMAIGFCASQPQCQIFRDILQHGLGGPCGHVPSYQWYGTELVYRFAGVTPMQAKHPSEAAGVQVVRALRERYPDMDIATLPQNTVYPFDWREIGKIFESDVSVPEECLGMHWFGGDPLSQTWNRLLTPESWTEYNNTFTSCLRAIGTRAFLKVGR